MQHRTRVLTLGPTTSAAICSCGWRGPKQQARVRAQVDAANHEYDSAPNNGDTDLTEVAKKFVK